MTANNTARGYRRLAVAVTLIWLVAWLSVGAFAAWQQGIHTDIFLDASKHGRMGEMVVANEQSSRFASLTTLSLGMAALTFPLAILFAIGWWVYRGFRL